MDNALAETLVALVVILAGARVLGGFAVRLGQPRIGGEMVAGLLIGGLLLSPWSHAGAQRHAAVLGGSAVQFINQLGQVGVILYLLLVGLTLSPGDLKRNGKRIAATSLPIALVAVALAPVGVDWFGGPRWHLGTGAAGALAMAAALMINGFPFVARILQERELLHGEFGATVLGSSALLTTTALLLLAVAEHRFGSPSMRAVFYPLGLVATVAIGATAAVLWPSVAARSPVVVGAGTGLVLAVIAALLAAWLSLKLLGTPLLGSFLVGIALSRCTARRDAIERALGWSVPVILVPIFLAGAGARVDPGMLDLGVLGGAAGFTVLLVAVALLGGSASSRFPVLGAGDASAIAALLNCRGLMLLAVAVEMSDHRLIGSRLVAVYFIGAVATTMMTGVLFTRAQRRAHRTASRNHARPPAWSMPAGTAVAGDAARRPPGS